MKKAAIIIVTAVVAGAGLLGYFRARIRRVRHALVQQMLASKTAADESDFENAPFAAALAVLAKSHNKRPDDYLAYRGEGSFSVLKYGEAVQLKSNGKLYVVAILGSSRSVVAIPGVSAQQLVLISQEGDLLDKLGCGINSRYGLIRTEVRVPPASDGAQLVLVFRPHYDSSGWHNYHDITYGGKTFRFREEQSEQPSVWDRKGLCRVKVEQGTFRVLFPELKRKED